MLIFDQSDEIYTTPQPSLTETLERLHQIAYRVPPSEDSEGETWQEAHDDTETCRLWAENERDKLFSLLAEVGLLLNTIRARDGAPYHDARYAFGHTAYMHPDAFDNLVERIREALGGTF